MGAGQVVSFFRGGRLDNQDSLLGREGVCSPKSLICEGRASGNPRLSFAKGSGCSTKSLIYERKLGGQSSVVCEGRWVLNHESNL